MTAVDLRSSATLAEPEERGTLSIDHAVVRKVAQRAADLVPGTAKVERKVAGLGLGTHGTGAKVSGRDNDVDLALDLALHYPAPVRTVVGEVREQVTREVEHITSYHVRSLAVTVSALLPEPRPRVR
ncbi:Asp23/Gls24 family envelope stress response protein [Amycolatopsis magusensis]|uniref:Alkaline shock family protein YloU n=1 Tax=Amycolatopsis magusensis TaxID=882444 RepID=A0ABS4PUG5_9PSEU|nr:Asp23/Gls24 family envelope stress response protein [Amycolatopsis magusensis]MBP2182483.1 putative alkaline shock family protein YloU [Amycolatopsis magusensis]